MRASRARGFTLVELLVVLALIAVAAAVTGLALRDPAQAQLEREAVRLAALLEVARTEARASGLQARWETLGTDADDAGGFRFVGLPAASGLPTRWLDPSTGAEVIGARAVLLGPDPILPPQRIALRLENHRVVIASDGLGPFAVVSSETVAGR